MRGTAPARAGCCWSHPRCTAAGGLCLRRGASGRRRPRGARASARRCSYHGRRPHPLSWARAAPTLHHIVVGQVAWPGVVALVWMARARGGRRRRRRPASSAPCIDLSSGSRTCVATAAGSAKAGCTGAPVQPRPLIGSPGAPRSCAACPGEEQSMVASGASRPSTCRRGRARAWPRRRALRRPAVRARPCSRAHSSARQARALVRGASARNNQRWQVAWRRRARRPAQPRRCYAARDGGERCRSRPPPHPPALRAMVVVSSSFGVIAAPCRRRAVARWAVPAAPVRPRHRRRGRVRVVHFSLGVCTVPGPRPPPRRRGGWSGAWSGTGLRCIAPGSLRSLHLLMGVPRRNEHTPVRGRCTAPGSLY